MTWSPLAGGFLTGKYEDGVPLYSRASMKVRSMFRSFRWTLLASCSIFKRCYPTVDSKLQSGHSLQMLQVVTRMRGKAQPDGRPALQIIETPFLYFLPLLDRSTRAVPLFD